MSTKMTFFIVCGKSPLTGLGGGYSTIARNIGKNLVKLGQDVFILALDDQANSQKTDFGTLVTVPVPFVRINISALPGLPFYSFLFAKKINSVMKKNNVKKAIVWGIGPWGLAGTILRYLFHAPIIHITGYFTTARHEWLGSLKALRVSDYGWFIRLKFILIYHTVVQMISFFDYIVLKSSHRIITNYQSTEKIIEHQFNIDRSQFLRITFPTQAYTRQTKVLAKIRAPKNYMLYLSRHDPRKGINILLHAMKILSQKEQPLPLIIAGTGELYEANKRLAEKLGLSNMVTFTGFVDDPILLMKKAKIFCFPTLEEGAGALIINEAMSMGIPIVTTACDGIPEDLEHKTSALLVPPGDAAVFADALRTLSHSPALQKRLGLGARQRYHDLYKPSVIKRDFQKLLNSLRRMSV